MNHDLLNPPKAEPDPYPVCITEVEITFVSNPNWDDGLIGYATCELNYHYYLGSIAIFRKPEGGFVLGYPDKQLLKSRLRYHRPSSRPMALLMKRAIFSKLNEILEQPSNKASSPSHNE